MIFSKVFGFDLTFKVMKIQVPFSSYDLCDIEKSVKTDMCIIRYTYSEIYVTIAVIITTEMVVLHRNNAPGWPFLESEQTEIWSRQSESLHSPSHQISSLGQILIKCVTRQ